MSQYFSFQWHITDECDQRCKDRVERHGPFVVQISQKNKHRFCDGLHV